VAVSFHTATTSSDEFSHKTQYPDFSPTIMVYATTSALKRSPHIFVALYSAISSMSGEAASAKSTSKQKLGEGVIYLENMAAREAAMTFADTPQQAACTLYNRGIENGTLSCSVNIRRCT
jgi:hypothetical protein